MSFRNLGVWEFLSAALAVVIVWGLLGYWDAQDRKAENRQADQMAELCRLKSPLCMR